MVNKNGLLKKIATSSIIGISAFLSSANNTNAELIMLKQSFTGLPHYRTPGFYFGHLEGAKEGFDDHDIAYFKPNAPAVNLNSTVENKDVYIEFKDLDSFSPFIANMASDGINERLAGYLEFEMIDEENLNNRQYFADIYKGDSPLFVGINVLDSIENKTRYNLDIVDGEKFSINVTSIPEPASFVLFAGLGLGLGAYALKRNKKIYG
jgi:hypothetical protein